jgi:hypothetical protein
VLLNENQARRLRITCQHVDRTLSEIEGILDESASATAFPAYVDNISPAQREAITEAIARIRHRLIETLTRQEVDPKMPAIPVSRAILGRMYIVDIAAEEIRPRRMKGYGSLSPDAAVELERFANDLKCITRQVDQALREQEK